MVLPCNEFVKYSLFVVKVILQLAESGSFLGQVDLFKVRGKFALSDAYEDHFMLPKGRVLIVTHRRVVLLQVSWCALGRIVVFHSVEPFPAKTTV